MRNRRFWGSARRYALSWGALLGLIVVFNCNGGRNGCDSGSGCNGCSGLDNCETRQTCEDCVDQCLAEFGISPNDCRVSVCGDVCQAPPPGSSGARPAPSRRPAR